MNQYEQFQNEQGYVQQNVQQTGELDWNSSISKDSDFILLPDGDYDFTVESFDRARHTGSDKLPACNKAIVKIRIDTPQGTITLNHNLFLHTKTEGMLSSFFAAIGQKKKDAPLQMNWTLVPGSKGRLKLGHKLYNDNKYNEIKKFYPASGYDQTSVSPMNNGQQGGYTPGKF